MVDVRRVKLPGVGVLHTFVTDDGGKVGVIAAPLRSQRPHHLSGRRRMATTRSSLRLDEDEAHTLAELLGGTRITESLSALDQIPGRLDRLVPGRLRRPHRRAPSATCPRPPVSPSSPSFAANPRTRRPPRTSSCSRRHLRRGRPAPTASKPCSARFARATGPAWRRAPMLRMMLRPRWVLALVAALAIAAGFALLGQWQLERAAEQAVIEDAPPRTCGPLADVAQPDGPTQQAATGQRVR